MHSKGTLEFDEINPDDPEWGACELWADADERPVSTMVCGVSNAQRLTVCWNACAGISNEALDAGVIGKLVEVLEWVSVHADVRSKDDSKTFARVNRGALRTIATRASEVLALVRQP